MTPFNLFATVPKGIESLLLKELRQLGAQKIRKVRAGISFTGDLETAYRCCLWSRLASRVLLQLLAFPVTDEDSLYAACNAFPWEDHLAPEQSFAVAATLVDAPLTHSHYAALKVKDAIVDRFRDRCGVRPSVDTREPDLRINLHLRRKQGSLALDLSGESLHRRGYRQQAGAAPLKENLAAALLLLADWPAIAASGGSFVDPMSGSGTLPLEAALMAGDIAPGLLRDRFGFERWAMHDPEVWRRVLDDARTRRTSGAGGMPRIAGFDADPAAIRNARANAVACGLEGSVHFEKRAVESSEPFPVSGNAGLVLANPPYGERLGERKRLRVLYARLGERLKQEFAGWSAAVLTSDEQLAFALGLRPQKSFDVYNGALACRLHVFTLSKPEPSDEPAGHPAAVTASTPGAEMFANRLRKNARRLGKWARKNGIGCYRVYDADMPEYAVAIDLYGDRVHVQEYAPPDSVDPDAARTRLDDVLEVLPGVLGVRREHVVVKVRERQKGTAQYRPQAHEGDFVEVAEGPARLLVNLTDYLDTGLFLDHRPVRRMIGEMAAGKRFLNLFAYTGSATVHAALGGALSSVSVDMSRTYLDWAQRNLELNGFGPPQHRLVQADCLAWPDTCRDTFDLIFLDPPTFSNSKRMNGSFDVQRDHVALLRSVLRLLTPGGTLIFSTNFRRFKLAEEAFPDVSVSDITVRSIPEDFSRNRRIHSCFLLQNPGKG